MGAGRVKWKSLLRAETRAVNADVVVENGGEVVGCVGNRRSYG